jgi:hypothetical protein
MCKHSCNDGDGESISYTNVYASCSNLQWWDIHLADYVKQWYYWNLVSGDQHDNNNGLHLHTNNGSMCKHSCNDGDGESISNANVYASCGNL